MRPEGINSTDLTPVEHIKRNAKNEATKAFLDDIWRACARHKMMIDRVTPMGKLWVRQLDDDDEEFIYSAIDTTREDFAA